MPRGRHQRRRRLASLQSWPCRCDVCQRCSHFAARAGMPSISSRHARSTVRAVPHMCSNLVRLRCSGAEASILASRTRCALCRSWGHSLPSFLSSSARLSRASAAVLSSQSAPGTWHASMWRSASMLWLPCVLSSCRARVMRPCSLLPVPAASSTLPSIRSTVSRVARMAAMYVGPALHCPVYTCAIDVRVMPGSMCVSGTSGASANSRSVTVRPKPAKPQNLPEAVRPNRRCVRAPCTQPCSFVRGTALSVACAALLAVGVLGVRCAGVPTSPLQRVHGPRRQPGL